MYAIRNTDMSIVTYTSCAYRLPCGICTRTNMACTVDATPAAPVQPGVTSVYAAPAYPYNHMTITGEGGWRDEKGLNQ